LKLDAQLKVEDHKVAVNGGEIRVRAVIPTLGSETFPLLVYFHGGGAMVQ